ncbi:MAG: hypothetical protein KKD86_02240 [Bacteroidetes bacterium]|nr:hypothetical protein [Bacteroidota bacterium]
MRSNELRLKKLEELRQSKSIKIYCIFRGERKIKLSDTYWMFDADENPMDIIGIRSNKNDRNFIIDFRY